MVGIKKKNNIGKYDVNEVVQRYNVDLKRLEKEQNALAKSLVLTDSIDFSSVARIGGISSIFFQNKIISAVVVLDSNFELLEQKYFSEKLRFPYIPGFRAYRELPAMVSCFNELEEKPEIVFIQGHGVTHPRLGLASHFSIACGVPTVGIADSLIGGGVDGENIILNGQVVGRVMQTKIGGKPLYVSAGNMISLESSCDLVKRFTKEPHKLPEPIHQAHKYSKEVLKEVFNK
jgi:deoxyribonuclease V